MKTAVNYFDEIKQAYNLASDYALAPMLGLTRSAVSMGRKNNATLDDRTCHRIAELLRIDPALILAEMNFHRAKTDEAKATWERMAATFRQGDTTNSMSDQPKTPAASDNEDAQNANYVKSVIPAPYRIPAIPERFKH